jgi:transketolase
MNLSTAKAPTRLTFTDRMLEYGGVDRDFVVIDMDLGYATTAWRFAERYPGRYLNMGIAELAALSAAAGMASCGRKVVVCGYGVFLTMRALESVRSMVCYPGLDVKLVSSHSGITASIDGVSHQATEDVAFMTTLPNMKVLAPVDTASARRLFDVARETPGPVFARLMKDPLYELYGADETFVLGGSKRPREGSDVTVVAYGDVVFQALEAAETLAGSGVQADVLDFYSVKPWDRGALAESLERTGALVVVENHQARNGLGYELAAWCLKHKPVPFENLGLQDTFAECGSYRELLGKYGISAHRIADAALQVVAAKGSRRAGRR